MILPPVVAIIATKMILPLGGGTNSHRNDIAIGGGTNSHRNDIATGGGNNITEVILTPVFIV